MMKPEPPRVETKFEISVNTDPRKLVRWMRRGGVPLGKDHKPIKGRPHRHASASNTGERK